MSGWPSTVAAYDPRNAELLWSRDDLGWLVDVHVHRDRVLVSGCEFVILDPEDHIEESHFVAIGLDRSGQTVWDDRHVDECVRASVVSDGLFIVAGEEWQARVYEPGSGRLVAEQPAEETPESRWIWDLAGEDGRYGLVGATFRDDSLRSPLDFAVRSYELSR